MATQIQRAVASARLSFIEKYGFCYEEDLITLKNALGASIKKSEDGKRVHISYGTYNMDAEIRRPEAASSNTQKGGWIEA
jgi:hypothetical protein